MPKVIAYLPAEKIQIDSVSNTASIISILQEIHTVIPLGVPPPPPNTFTTTGWSILSLWEKGPGDDGKSFESQSRLLSANNDQLLITTITKFVFPPHINLHRTVELINAFPIWVPGRHRLQLLFREGSDGQFQQVAEFPIVLIHERQTKLN